MPLGWQLIGSKLISIQKTSDKLVVYTESIMLREQTRITDDSGIERLVEEVTQLTHPLNTREDLDPLIERIGDAHFVLLGEASHGTSDYYQWRARLSSRLIAEKGFRFVAVEGDWPDCYHVNRYVKGYPDAGKNAREVLHAFKRW